MEEWSEEEYEIVAARLGWTLEELKTYIKKIGFEVFMKQKKNELK